MIIRHIYPNLCLNLPHFGAHYTGAARRKNFKSSVGPDGLKYSPFRTVDPDILDIMQDNNNLETIKRKKLELK